MKKTFVILFVLFAILASCTAFAEVCDLEGLTFEIPLQFAFQNEEDGLKSFFDKESQMLIFYGSYDREGATADALLEEFTFLLGAPFYTYNLNCHEDAIPHLSIEMVYNRINHIVNFRIAIFFDDEKIYIIYFAKDDTMEDDDVETYKHVLQSVQMENPQEPIKYFDESSRIPEAGYKYYELYVPELDGLQPSLDIDNIAYAYNDDLGIALKTYETENMTMEEVISSAANFVTANSTTYRKDCEIGGIPYVDYTFEGSDGQGIKGALFLNDENKRGYVIYYVERNGMSEKGYETWDYILNNIHISARRTRYETLQKGDKGDAVKRLQEALITLGYLDGAADGNFGPKTEKAVEKYQQDKGLEVSKIADQQTQECLFSDEELYEKIQDNN